MFFCVAGAQSAQFPRTLLLKLVGVRTQPQNIVDHFIKELSDSGSENLVNCKIMNFKLHTNLLHVKGCTPIFHFEYVSIQTRLDFDTNSNMKLLLKFKTHGCKILMEEI